MGVALGDFAKGFVFSPRVWSGIAVAGLAVVLFVASGPLRRRRVKPGQDKQAAEGRAGGAATLPAGARGGQVATRPTATVPAATPAKGRKGKSAADDDDDLGDVADILRRHGIT